MLKKLFYTEVNYVLNYTNLSVKRAIVLTTINPPNKAIAALNEGTQQQSIPFIVVGDTKTPVEAYRLFDQFYSIERQVQQFPRLCEVLPTKHYSRKNVGYLVAMELGVDEIQETDDDNIPLSEFWKDVPRSVDVDVISSEHPWFNVYSVFSEQTIWPRGFPLEFVQVPNPIQTQPQQVKGLIIQDLADDNPDVDAVYRLTRPLPVRFSTRTPVMLQAGSWCPFNSQNTIFRKQVFPLLYLPSKCSFRMTDIWRSFVAQRCLWECGEGVIFRQPSVFQERNAHNLLKDFEDEVPGYLLNERIRKTLESLDLDDQDTIRSLVLCYEAMIDSDLLPDDEMPILRAWCREIERVVS